MKKKIAILGSTGSIGKTLIRILSKDKKNIKITLLTANTDYKTLFKQAKIFNVKNLIITDPKTFNFLKKNKKYRNLKIFNNFKCFKKIFLSKNDYIMSSIVGLQGLNPTIKSIKFTNKILIANKESIICGWNLIQKELKKYKTDFIPIDSEHFSIWSLLNNNSVNNVDKIYITASGGPFFNRKLEELICVKPSEAIKHPKWSMGKKISIDSATLMNKVFEVIEAKKIFNLPYSKIKILIHRESYLHAIAKFSNGITKLLIHDTSMSIPIFNSIYENKKFKSKEIDFFKLNKLSLMNVNKKRFPLTKIINMLPNYSSMFETVLISANDELVNLFLQNRITFNQITTYIIKILNMNDFKRYKLIKVKNVNEILRLSKIVRFKIRSLCV